MTRINLDSVVPSFEANPGGGRLDRLTGLRPNLIYDVGLHRGEDTDFYLRMGFDVVALEANPELVAQCKTRFEDAIARGRLRIIEGAIAPASAGEKVIFFKNPKASLWGTIDQSWAERNVKLGYASERIELRRIDIVEVYRTFGVPFYLKIDVEGVDRLVLDSLRQFEARPRYVSIESEKVDFAELEVEMELLRNLGYTKFKPVQQAAIAGTAIKAETLDGKRIDHIFEQDASGPFGEDIPQPWLSLDDTLREYEGVFRKYRRFGDHSLFVKMPVAVQKVIGKSWRVLTGDRGPLPGWYDTHASL
jgi:FkbM family methyltransferase